MADVTMRPPTGETMDIGDATGPMADMVLTGSMRDPSGNAVSPAQGKTAYDHSQVTGNPHGTTASGVGADAAGTAAAAVSAHDGLGTAAHGGIVASTDARLTDARTPTAHHATHEPSGTDAMTVDAAAATGSLRTLGTGATSACAGNDARLSDARTPAAHAASHATAGGDAVAPSAIGAEPALGNPLVSGYVLASTDAGVRSWVAGGGGDIADAVILAPAASTRNVIQPTGAAVIPMIVKGASAQTANLQEWQNSAGAAVAMVDAAGDLGLGMATAPYRLSVQGTAVCDTPVLGAEILAASPWTSTGWTGSWATGWIHTVGSSDALVFTTAIGAGSYKVTYTVTGRTAGAFNMALGGVSLLAQTASNVWGTTTITGGTSLTVTPTSDFNGTIAFSMKAITGDSTPIMAFYDANGVAVEEFRTNDALGENTFVGIAAGARNVGKGNTAIGYGAGGRHVGGTRNALLGAYCGYSIGSGSGNVCAGYQALQNLNNGNNNVALGYGAVNKSISSISNIGIGFNTLYNALGSYNIAIGQGCFQQVSSGAQNLGIGPYSVGSLLTTGSNNIFIGLEADLASSTQRSRAMAIGYKAKVDLDDACVIGQTGTSAPLVGLNTTTPGAQIHAIARTAGTIGTIIQGAAAQTANLQEWRDSTDAVRAAVLPEGSIRTASDAYFYMGVSTTDGSWRIGRSGTGLVMERRESGSWVTKQTISA